MDAAVGPAAAGMVKGFWPKSLSWPNTGDATVLLHADVQREGMREKYVIEVANKVVLDCGLFLR
eukprot:3319100-Prorocentrum_lima.AAC.1